MLNFTLASATLQFSLVFDYHLKPITCGTGRVLKVQTVKETPSRHNSVLEGGQYYHANRPGPKRKLSLEQELVPYGYDAARDWSVGSGSFLPVSDISQYSEFYRGGGGGGFYIHNKGETGTLSQVKATSRWPMFVFMLNKTIRRLKVYIIG